MMRHCRPGSGRKWMAEGTRAEMVAKEDVAGEGDLIAVVE